MKKLMIAAAIVCVAAVSQAAVANWTATASEIYNGAGEGTEVYATGNALFFDAGQMSQTALYALWDAGTAIGSSTSGYIGQSAIDYGTTALDFSYGEQGDGKLYSYYFAIVDGSDKIYFSNILSDTPNAAAASKNLMYGDQYNWDYPEVLPNSMALPTEGYVGAGQWAASAVPEPTSGLLLLLGVAGLALRRRRA